MNTITTFGLTLDPVEADIRWVEAKLTDKHPTV